MFEKLQEKLMEYAETKMQEKINLQHELNELKESDEVAANTKWNPLKPGGTNIKTHKLKVDEMRDVVKLVPTFGFIFFTMIFILIGVGVMSIPFINFTLGNNLGTEAFIIMPLFGGVFFTAGFCMLVFGGKHKVFNKDYGVFYSGKFNPNKELRNKSVIPLESIYAIQLISEYVRGDKSSYYSYEINLVLNDSSRVSVVDHGNMSSILRDAKSLSEYLEVPLWDTIK